MVFCVHPPGHNSLSLAIYCRTTAPASLPTQRHAKVSLPLTDSSPHTMLSQGSPLGIDLREVQAQVLLLRRRCLLQHPGGGVVPACLLGPSAVQASPNGRIRSSSSWSPSLGSRHLTRFVRWRYCGDGNHQGMRALPGLDGRDPRDGGEVADERGRLLPELPKVDGAAAGLEQQHLIKGLHPRQVAGW